VRNLVRMRNGLRKPRGVALRHWKAYLAPALGAAAIVIESFVASMHAFFVRQRTATLALFLVVVAVLGSVLLTGGGQGGGEQGGKPESKEPKDEDRTFTKRCEIGNPCELGEGVFVVVSAERRDSLRISLPGSRINGPMLLLRWRWTWQGDLPRYAIRAPRPLILRDSQGRVYEESFEPTRAYQIDRGLRAGFAKQNPGQTLRGASVYMIPADAYGFSLEASALVDPTMKEVARYDLGWFYRGEHKV